MCLATSHNLLLKLQDGPKHIFSHEIAIFWSAKKWCKHLFSTLHPLSPLIFATAAVVAFVLLCNSRFNFHCYTQRETTLTQKSTQKWCCDLSRLLAQKITKGIHSCKPASLNYPIQMCTAQLMGTFTTYLLQNDKELPNKQTKAFPWSFFNKATDKGPVAGRYFFQSNDISDLYNFFGQILVAFCTSILLHLRGTKVLCSSVFIVDNFETNSTLRCLL